jgi:hypothetical protein
MEENKGVEGAAETMEESIEETPVEKPSLEEEALEKAPVEQPPEESVLAKAAEEPVPEPTIDEPVIDEPVIDEPVAPLLTETKDFVPVHQEPTIVAMSLAEDQDKIEMIPHEKYFDDALAPKEISEPTSPADESLDDRDDVRSTITTEIVDTATPVPEPEEPEEPAIPELVTYDEESPADESSEPPVSEETTTRETVSHDHTIEESPVHHVAVEEPVAHDADIIEELQPAPVAEVVQPPTEELPGETIITEAQDEPVPEESVDLASLPPQDTGTATVNIALTFSRKSRYTGGRYHRRTSSRTYRGRSCTAAT